MGTKQVVEANISTPRGLLAPDLHINEEETFLVASQTGAITITEGDILALDASTTTGGLKSNRVIQADFDADTTAWIVGVALETKVIPATTAAADLHVTMRVMRRGFHPAVNVVTGGAAGDVVTLVTAVAAGRGSAVDFTTVPVTQLRIIAGYMLGAASNNLAPVYVSPVF